MSSRNPDGRVFTFVDYDINRRGVTDTARAHLMRDRVRSKREARSEWVSRNQFSPLRWMRPKEDNNQPNPGRPDAKPSSSDESEEVTKPRISHYAAVIDFERDCVTVSPFARKPRSQSPRSRKGTKSQHRKNMEFHDNSPESSASDRKHGRSPEEGCRMEMSRLNSPFLDADSPRSIASLVDCEPMSSNQRRTSMESRSEFGLALLDRLRIANTPPRQLPIGLDAGLEEESQQIISQALHNSAARLSTVWTPVEHNLLQYFAVNAVPMLGLDLYPEIVQKHDPVLQLFLPYATSSQWCFETMILLFSANHQRLSEAQPDRGDMDAENHHLASRQNLILARTRERISSLANCNDSSDEDVVAFLFLALAEYCTGNRQIGLMHFKAWKEYCEMRRVFGIRPCGLPCKTIVWWCVSVMCEDDVSLDGIINPTTRARIRDDPAKLFRYFESWNGAGYVDMAQLSRPELCERRITC
ncbi:hypothetical protein A1O7_09161 [Cladophialophora yegresii CBS 114405]|uniref:Transcription factor domain-containing protein n=1 Tax=Cladophialophora yegresii CBS 114405 TaxID=1182544 RepID=W9VLB1_9EURO|nr:uncharacterized protein A1O7_09161 [Cladophialophora yegresii CBS 114405]EXJ53825.1 hypothetical protein A1O7_09161 [Cladophialophora yegresii CBS 114405]